MSLNQFRGVARIFSKRGHTVSHPGYLPDCADCDVNLHAVFTKSIQPLTGKDLYHVDFSDSCVFATLIDLFHAAAILSPETKKALFVHA